MTQRQLLPRTRASATSAATQPQLPPRPHPALPTLATSVRARTRRCNWAAVKVAATRLVTSGMIRPLLRRRLRLRRPAAALGISATGLLPLPQPLPLPVTMASAILAVARVLPLAARTLAILAEARTRRFSSGLGEARSLTPLSATLATDLLPRLLLPPETTSVTSATVQLPPRRLLLLAKTALVALATATFLLQPRRCLPAMAGSEISATGPPRLLPLPPLLLTTDSVTLAARVLRRLPHLVALTSAVLVQARTLLCSSGAWEHQRVTMEARLATLATPQPPSKPHRRPQPQTLVTLVMATRLHLHRLRLTLSRAC